MGSSSVMIATTHTKPYLLLACWGAAGAGLLLGAGFAIPLSEFFGYETQVVDMPLMELFIALMMVTIPFVLLPLLVHKTLAALDLMKNRQQATQDSCKIFVLFDAGRRVCRAFFHVVQRTVDGRRLSALFVGRGAQQPMVIIPIAILPRAEIFNGTSGQPGLDMTNGRTLGDSCSHASTIRQLRTIYPPVAQLDFYAGLLAGTFQPDRLAKHFALALELATLGFATGVIAQR